MRPLSILLALAAWLCSAFPLLVGIVWGLGLRCDETCDQGSGWEHDPDAWQWKGLFVLGVVAFLAGAALVLFVWRRQRLYAAGAVVVGLTAALAMFGGFTSDWIDHLGRRSPPELLFLAASFLAPVLAVLLTGARSGGPVEEPS
jgi:hypothetical protein